MADSDDHKIESSTNFYDSFAMTLRRQQNKPPWEIKPESVESASASVGLTAETKQGAIIFNWDYGFVEKIGKSFSY